MFGEWWLNTEKKKKQGISVTQASLKHVMSVTRPEMKRGHGKKKKTGVGAEAGVNSSPRRSSEEMAGESRGEAPHACQFTRIAALD